MASTSAASISGNIFFHASSSSPPSLLSLPPPVIPLSSPDESSSCSSSSSLSKPMIPLKRRFWRSTPYLRRKAFAVRSKPVAAPSSAFHGFGAPTVSSSSEDDQQYQYVSYYSSSPSDMATPASSSGNIFFDEFSSSSSSLSKTRIQLKKRFRRPTPYSRRKTFAVRSKPAYALQCFGRSISSSSEDDQQYGGAAAAEDSVGSNTTMPSPMISTHTYIQIDDSSSDSEGSVNNY